MNIEEYEKKYGVKAAAPPSLEEYEAKYAAKPDPRIAAEKERPLRQQIARGIGRTVSRGLGNVAHGMGDLASDTWEKLGGKEFYPEDAKARHREAHPEIQPGEKLGTALVESAVPLAGPVRKAGLLRTIAKNALEAGAQSAVLSEEGERLGNAAQSMALAGGLTGLTRPIRKGVAVEDPAVTKLMDTVTARNTARGAEVPTQLSLPKRIGDSPDSASRLVKAVSKSRGTGKRHLERQERGRQVTDDVLKSHLHRVFGKDPKALKAAEKAFAKRRRMTDALDAGVDKLDKSKLSKSDLENLKVLRKAARSKNPQGKFTGYGRYGPDTLRDQAEKRGNTALKREADLVAPLKTVDTSKTVLDKGYFGKKPVPLGPRDIAYSLGGYALGGPGGAAAPPLAHIGRQMLRKAVRSQRKKAIDLENTKFAEKGVPRIKDRKLDTFLLGKGRLQKALDKQLIEELERLGIKAATVQEDE